ncbi:MAG: hypothetical protein P4M11_04635 [Candidatus Pacebacteria bacterium]|nr:hypothetical protein [Candidatus Paceibacterota bacterium]
MTILAIYKCGVFVNDYNWKSCRIYKVLKYVFYIGHHIGHFPLP